MKKLIILICFITNILNGQNSNEAEKIMNSVYDKLIQGDGSLIYFEYLFENESHKMENPIYGKLGLFTENRFYLEFNQSSDNEVIQIYDGESLFTILLEEQEIQIDEMEDTDEVFIKNIFKNYKTDFKTKIKYKNNNQTIIELTPIQKYNDNIYNQCIEELKLPECLKLPNQCRIGIRDTSKQELEMCLSQKGGYIENNILKIELIINSSQNKLEAITQLNRYNGKTSIQVNDIKPGDSQLLDIKKPIYKNFEIIDLR